MARKRVRIDQCVTGDIVATDVLNDHGVCLIVRGTMLNGYIIDKLRTLGIEEVQLYDSDDGWESDLQDHRQFLAFSDDYYRSIICTKQIIAGLAAGGKADRALIQKVSDDIMSSLEQNGSVASFIQVLKSYDDYTYTHSNNTAYYSLLIGKWMGFSQSELRTLVQAGLLHDIGKVRVPCELLNKKVLTRDEFETIKQHTVWGKEILEDAGVEEQDIKNAVLLHHERVDGSGYPFKVRAEDVVMHARIVAVADVFDAMTSDRVYKKGVSPFEAFEMFKTVGLGIFDPVIVNTFVKNLATYYVGSVVRLTNGERGRVVFVPPHDVLSPIIAIGDRIVDLGHHRLKVEAILPLSHHR